MNISIYRLTDYLRNYSIALIVFTVCADFYSSILLARSKLFGINIFNLSLKESELDQLNIFKFMSNTLFEVCRSLI